MHTLRQRLILSHMLPSLLLIPIMGIVLIYVIETRVVLANLSSELTGQAVLIAELAEDYPGVWSDAETAQAFVARIDPRVSARLMLLDRDGRLLASSDPADAPLVGSRLAVPEIAHVLSGRAQVRTTYSRHLHEEVVDVFIPVWAFDERQVVGIVRLNHRLATVHERFLRVRQTVALVSLGGLLLSALVGWTLALHLERPLERITRAIQLLASGQSLDLIPEQGPREIRSLAHAFNVLVTRLRTLEETRHRLLANLVHELGRPLGALHSAIQALLGGADEDPRLRRELLAGMEGEVEHLRRLLDDLSHVHDQLAGALELARRPVPLGKWLPQALAPWRASAQEKGLQWVATIPADLPALQADPDRLAQALGNLLSNAIMYTPSGGRVAVDAGVADGAVWIRVSDTGPGIPPDEQARIFTPFYRGRQARRFPQGMGLGLTIAHDLVVAHGGRLEVESTPGQGSRFTIWLPLE
ncbi:MAG: HAMP domain-containing histidine kinase [Anaerolineae bacterium]|nr:HAMP domain-containing histidine kinase [Anaerolineae bacterium]